MTSQNSASEGCVNTSTSAARSARRAIMYLVRRYTGRELISSRSGPDSKGTSTSVIETSR